MAVESNAVSYARSAPDARTAADSGDRIAAIRLSLIRLPLATPVSDAKVLTGRQKPLTEIAFVFAEIRSRDGNHGIGSAMPSGPAGRACMRMPASWPRSCWGRTRTTFRACSPTCYGRGPAWAAPA